MPKKSIKKESGLYHWNAMTSSGGTLELSLYFPNTKPTKADKEEALAAALADSFDFMLSKGYLPPETRFLSSSDIANKYGYTRQYWEKLLNEGKIPYKETAAGRITTDLWVEGYVNNKEKVDAYVRNLRRVLKSIEEGGKKSGSVECPQCGEARFEYFVNVNSNTNGLCRAGCGFRIHTTA